MNFKNISAFKLYFKEYWTFFLLPILIFIFYFSILNFGYVHFEDNNVIIHNSKMLQETSAFAKVLTSDVNFGNTSNAFRPLQNLTFWIDTQLFGFNPFGYHLTNLLLHIICSLMIMKYTFLISKKRSASFLIASVFAIHPFSMMTIAWIPGRGDLLLLLFGTMFLIGIQHLNHKSSHKNLLLIALSLFLALLSNETAYVLVPLAVLLTFIRKIKWEKNQFFKFSISLIIPAIVSLFVRLLFIPFGTSVVNNFGFTELMRNFKVLPYSVFLAFVPFDISLMETVDITGIVIGLIILVLIIIVCLRITTTNREIVLTGLSIFILMFLPTLFYSPDLKQFAFDTLLNRLYMPMLGLCIMLIPVYLYHRITKFFLVIFLHLLILYSSLLIIQFKNADKFYSNVIKHSPSSALALNNYAAYLVGNGHKNLALSYFSKAIEIKNDYPDALFNRANNYLSNGAYNLALNDINMCISLNPGYIPAYTTRGTINMRLNENSKACEDWNRAVSMGDTNALVLMSRYCR